jgi:hypothetical protein
MHYKLRPQRTPPKLLGRSADVERYPIDRPIALSVTTVTPFTVGNRYCFIIFVNTAIFDLQKGSPLWG